MITAVRRGVAGARWFTRIGLGRLRFGLRATLSPLVGVRLPRDFLMLDCATGEDASGLFSEAAAVVGCLAQLEAWPQLYAGLCVNFHDHGLYHETAAGPNWWQYYFEPISFGSGGRQRLVPDWEHDAFAADVELGMPRALAASIVRRFVIPRQAIRHDVERYWQDHFGDRPVLGVHYRGTDKWETSPVVPLDTIAHAVSDAAGACGDRWMVFVATDEQRCLDFMEQRFPGRVQSRTMRRSTDGRPLHKTPGNGHRKGLDAVIDCLLLARTAHLVRTDSDLSLFATFFNPALPVSMFGEPT